MECSLRNFKFVNKDRMMNNVQNCDSQVFSLLLAYFLLPHFIRFLISHVHCLCLSSLVSFH
jgi:hypothetical protein